MLSIQTLWRSLETAMARLCALCSWLPGRRQPQRRRIAFADFTFDAAADWYLLIGDETALPAVAAIADTLPERVQVLAFIETGAPVAQGESDVFSRLQLRWFSREMRWLGPDLCLEETLENLVLPIGAGRVWLAGDESRMRRLRDLLVDARILAPRHIHTAAYWQFGLLA